MRKTLLVANWKMNKSYRDLEAYVSALVEHIQNKNIDIALAPPFPFLDKLGHLLKSTSVRLAAQNAFWESKGAYTGEVSLGMLKEVGVEYVILGHSERRQYFGETDETVCKKVKACIENKMTAILCVGESLEERKAEQTFSVIEKQVQAVIRQLANYDNFVIAYEPIWAIGTGVTASAKQAQDVHHFIRTLLAKQFSGSENVRILYGGSMNASNSKELLQQADIDGGLVGGSSLEAQSFLGIINS